MRIHYRKNCEYEGGEIIQYIEGSIDSSETKPVSLPNEKIADGSILTESDTGDVYFFNEETNAWVKQFSFQGA